jgi:hypothetical protein
LFLLVLCRNPLFKDVLKRISLYKGGMYTGPAYNALCEELLTRAEQHVIDELEPYFEHARRVFQSTSATAGQMFRDALS